MSIRSRPTTRVLRRVIAGLLPAVLALGLASACGSDEETTDEITVSGVFSITHGDPADFSPPAVIEYLLTDEEGRDWRLVFDEDVYEPAGGLRQFDREQVEVSGTPADEERTILVTSIAGGSADGPVVETSPAATATPGDQMRVSGFFSFLYGDPPPDSGEPAVIQYWLEDGEGRAWQLVFDEDVYRPDGGLRQFDHEQVDVEGVAMGEGMILVTAIAIAE